tara:strand:- start:3869 stop:4597 length:729 start_codon:yes stop_codon:yes gene_type:complete
MLIYMRNITERTIWGNFMHLPKAVIFDMDGLMLDTETISLNARRKAIDMHGLKIDDQWLYDIIGMNSKGADEYFRQKLGYPLPDEVGSTGSQFYQDHIDSHGIDLKDGIVELLEYLDANNIPRAVATSTREIMAHKKLKLTGIHHWFDKIICGDQVENSKPAPDIYLKAAYLLGTQPRDCLALEDSDNGSKAAHAAGMDLIVVPDLKQPSDQTNEMAHKVVKNLHDVKSYLMTLSQATKLQA